MVGADLELVALAAPHPPTARAGSAVVASADGGVCLADGGARIGALPDGAVRPPAGAAGRVRTLRRADGAVIGVSVRFDPPKPVAAPTLAPRVPPPKGDWGIGGGAQSSDENPAREAQDRM